MNLSQYSAQRPLLVWTDFPFDFGGGGAVIMRSLLCKDDLTRVMCVSPSRSSPCAVPPTVWLGRRAKRSLLLDSTLFAAALARETLEVAERANARAIWLVLHGAGVAVAAHLVTLKRFPMHLTVHDDPAFAVALRSRRYRLLTPWIERCLAQALSGAASIDVISESMSRRFLERYGVRSHIVHRAVPGPVLASPAYDVTNGLRIGVLGNTYSYSQLPLLGRAIANVARLFGVRGRITMIGRGAAAQLAQGLASTPGVDVEETGQLGEAEAISVLRKCFALYLNYPFGTRDAVLRQTSFPTKLSTYVLAARPVLLHAPPDSSIAELAAHEGYVYPWTSLDQVAGERVLRDMWQDDRAHHSAHETAEIVRNRYFNPLQNRETLLSALNSLVLPYDSPGSSHHRSEATAS